MLTQIELDKKFSQVFPKRQAKVLTEVLVEAHSDLVKAGDFNELKSIVKDLAEAQKRTEAKVLAHGNYVSEDAASRNFSACPCTRTLRKKTRHSSPDLWYSRNGKRLGDRFEICPPMTLV